MHVQKFFFVQVKYETINRSPYSHYSNPASGLKFWNNSCITIWICNMADK